MANYLDLTGLSKYDELIKNVINNPSVSVDITQEATQATVKVGVNKTEGSDIIIPAVNNTTAGLMSAADKAKLDGIAAGGEVNQNAFSNVKVGNVTVAADLKEDTLELVAGTNITITPDATNDKITISSSDTAHSHSVGTGLEIVGNGGTDGDVKYSLKTATDEEIGGIKVGYTENGANYPVELDSDNKAFVNVPWVNTTNFTINADGNVDTPTADTVAVVSNTTISLDQKPSQTNEIQFTAVNVPTKAYVDKAIGDAVTGLFEYKGTVGTGGTVTSLPATHAVGDVYYVKTAGTYAGESCEVGDMIVCITAGTTANDAHWEVLQGNWTAQDGTAKIPFGSTSTLATIGGVSIDAQIGTVNGDGTYIDVTADGDNLKVSHKDPVAVAASKISKDASGTATAAWGASIVTGVDIERDAKGHVTNMSLDSIKLPNNPHIEGANIITNSAGSATKTNVTANGDLYLNHVENGVVKSAINIEGVNGIEVTGGSNNIRIKLTDTAYQFAGGTNKFTVTKPSGEKQEVTVTPSIANNVTYSGTLTSGQLPVLDGAAGVIKASGFTIGKSVPANAVFTDTKCTTGTINAGTVTTEEGMVSVVSNAKVSMTGDGTGLTGTFTAVAVPSKDYVDKAIGDAITNAAPGSIPISDIEKLFA